MDFVIREDWLASVDEEVIDPERRIVDPHHHFFVETELFPHYRLEDLWADTATHNVVQTVFAQCGECYRKDGPEALRPVGETEWVAGIAAQASAQPASAQIAGIVGDADLRLGAGVREVLEAHAEASSLFRGIRHVACWDDSGVVQNAEGAVDARTYQEPKFREGLAVLADMGLSYDAYHYHHQTPYLVELARAYPQATIVLDHLGTPLGVGPYEGKRDEVFGIWEKGIRELASCPNVFVKLGGLAMPWNGFGFDSAAKPPSSDELVAVQGRYYQHVIEQFGAERCMFESNFPVDKLSLSYKVLWNAFKKMTAGASEDEKDALFRGTASRVYRL
jgi:predicted TIM-barrel fold metal-dependent hydrolase